MANMTVNRVRELMRDRLSHAFRGSANTKHCNVYKDYGYPENPTFWDFYKAYKRNPIGRAGIDRPVDKTWQDNPCIVVEGDVHTETPDERRIRLAFSRLMLWTKLKKADVRGRVGEYSALILRFADSKPFHEPVDRVPGGLDGLVEVIPAWSEQLKVSMWDTDTASPTYGQPMMYEFNEAEVDDTDAQNQRVRSFTVHPDRVHIWSDDGTVWGESALEAGLNQLIDIEKILGAGGEGFWKNAKSAPVLSMDKDARPENLAAMLGVPVNEIGDAMGEAVEEWQKGFDQLLMLQGIESKTLAVTLPNNPERFFMNAVQAFAASIPISTKILLGSQSGERASTEDANEFDEQIMSRRANIVVPNILRLIRKLVDFGVLPDREWDVYWSDLTAASQTEKHDLAKSMATTNKDMMAMDRVFTVDEIREMAGYEPMKEQEVDGFGEEEGEDA